MEKIKIFYADFDDGIKDIQEEINKWLKKTSRF